MTRRNNTLLLLAAGFVAGYFVTRKRWSLLHNCVAHPLAVVAEGSEWQKRFHDWTGEKWAEQE